MGSHSDFHYVNLEAPSSRCREINPRDHPSHPLLELIWHRKPGRSSTTGLLKQNQPIQCQMSTWPPSYIFFFFFLVKPKKAFLKYPLKAKATHFASSGLVLYIIEQPWIFTERTDAEAEAWILWPPEVENWGLFLVEVSGSCSLVAVCRHRTVVASLIAGHRL